MIAYKVTFNMVVSGSMTVLAESPEAAEEFVNDMGYVELASYLTGDRPMLLPDSVEVE